MEKLVSVKSLDNVKVTYLKNGQEVSFINGVANLPSEQAQELVDRNNKRYVLYDGKNAGLVKTPKPSIQNIELEYKAMEANPANLPLLRNWLREKQMDLEPKLLNIQQSMQKSMLPDQEKQSPRSSAQEDIASAGSQDVEKMPVDGEEGADETPVGRAQRLLRGAKKE
jgi:hypothetical protein